MKRIHDKLLQSINGHEKSASQINHFYLKHIYLALVEKGKRYNYLPGLELPMEGWKTRNKQKLANTDAQLRHLGDSMTNLRYIILSFFGRSLGDNYQVDKGGSQ